MGVVSHRGNYVTYSDNAPSVDVPPGAGTAYVLGIQCAPSHAIAWPAGFTEVPVSSEEVNLGMGLRAAIRPATGTESGTFVAELSGYGAWWVVCALVDGISTSLDDYSAKPAYVYSNTVALDGDQITTTGPDRLILFLASGGTGSGAAGTATVTPPAGLAIDRVVDRGNGSFIALASGVQASAGNATYTGSVDIGLGADSMGSNTITLAFAQATAPTPVNLVANAVAITSASAVITTSSTSGALVANAAADTSAAAKLTMGNRLVAHAVATTRARARMAGAANPSPFMQSVFNNPMPSSGPWMPTGPWFSSGN